MDKDLFDLVDQNMPRFNRRVVEGWAVHEMQHVEAHVHRIFLAAAGDFPPELKYLGYERCTPAEEFAVITRKQNNPSAHELARKDLYLVKYRFSFAGEELEPRYIYLPFVSDAGTLFINGSEFGIAPVLADKVMSVSPDEIFIPINRAKLKFRQVTHSFDASGQSQTVFVIWAEIYNRKQEVISLANKSPVRGKTTLAHYLFAKYGLRQTFMMFADANIAVGDHTTITPELYPADQWVICSSKQIQPSGVSGRYYVGSDLRVAIRADRFNFTTASMIGSLFYVVDRFPQRVLPEFIGQDGEDRLWKTLMGQLLFGSHVNEGKLVDDIENHLRSLDTYIDNEAKSDLMSDNVICDDLYQLMMYIIENYSNKVTKATQTVASMYDKRLMVRRYVLKDLSSAINTFMYKVKSFRSRPRPIDKNNVLTIMRTTLKMSLVTGMNRGHGEISSVSVPGDNKYFKVTSRVVPQTESSGSRTKGETANSAGQLLHASIAEVGSVSTMSKSDPSGRDKINPYVHVSEDGMIVRNPDIADVLDRVQRMIQR